jgi:hypothetical protein
MLPILALAAAAGIGSMLGKGDVNTNVSNQITQSQQFGLSFNPIINVSSPGSTLSPDIKSEIPQSIPISQTSSQPISETRTVPISLIPSSAGYSSLPSAEYTNATTPDIEDGIEIGGITIKPIYLLAVVAAIAAIVIFKKRRGGR